MERLKKVGDVKKFASREIHHSRLGIGFEKLDRMAFDPENAYDKVADVGVKWVRIQSGWARTEKEKGVYSSQTDIYIWWNLNSTNGREGGICAMCTKNGGINLLRK